MTYITRRIIDEALAAKAIPKRDHAYLIEGGRRVKDSPRTAEIHERIRTWLRRKSRVYKHLSGADAKAASVAKRYDIAELPPVADPMRRRHAERSALFFIRHYCTACPGGFLKTAVPAKMRRAIHSMQRCVTDGTPYHIREFRGGGKSSSVKGVTMWAIATGRARFAELVASNSRKAERMCDDIWTCMRRSPRFAEDFPEIAVFIAKTRGNPRRAPSISFRGESVGMQKSSDEFHLPTVEIDGKPTPASGALFVAVGFGANIRGEVRGDLRPDLIVFDDLQNRDMAKSPERVQDALDTIKADFLGGDSHTEISATLMTSTPICPDDLSERIAADPYWRTETYRLVERFPTCFDQNSDEGLWQEFARLWRHENSVERRDPHPVCNAFYVEHREEMDAGCIVANPNFYRRNEISAIEHAMILYFTRGAKNFAAEYQMEPVRDEAVVRITPDIVVSRVVPTLPAGIIPPQTVMTVAATDINPSYALSTVVGAIDSDRSVTVVDYWLQPCHIRGDANDTEFERGVYEAVAGVGRSFAERGIDAKAAGFHWGIDASGNQFKPVTDFAFNALSAVGFAAHAMLGRTDREFNPRVSTRKYSKIPGVNDTVLAWNAKTRREYIFFNKDRYEESAQRQWLSAIGAPGGVCLFGQRAGVPAQHDEFALQVCGERLRSKTIAAQERYNYVWEELYRHDLGDCTYMILALAGFFGLAAGGAPEEASSNPFAGWKF